MNILLSDNKKSLNKIGSSDGIENVADKTGLEIEENIGVVNSYGRPVLKFENIKKEHDGIVNKFSNFFSKLGYSENKSIGINSGIDKSVFFIGAPISALKPFIINQNIPTEGIYMSQECIRTRNTKKIFDDNSTPKWGSCFTGIAVLIPISKGEELLKDSISFLIKTLNIPLENIKIQINSEDKDLLKLLELVKCPIEIIKDEKEDSYYKHTYGMGEIVGRNFNFVLREKGKENFNDIGNFIIIEDSDKKYGIELALGTSVIMKELFELDHTLDTSCISNIFPTITENHRKLQDSIISSVLLFRLGVKPNGSKAKGKIFRSYIRGILYFYNKFNLTIEELINGIKKYEIEEFGEYTGSGEFITEYIETFQKILQSKKGIFSKEEKLLLNLNEKII